MCWNEHFSRAPNLLNRDGALDMVPTPRRELACLCGCTAGQRLMLDWQQTLPKASAGLKALGASGEQWRMVLIYASGPVPFQPQNLSFAFLLSTCPKPFIPSLPWSFLRMLPHALVPKSQTSYPDYLVNCTSWLLLHLNCTLPRNTPPTSANTCYPH